MFLEHAQYDFPVLRSVNLINSISVLEEDEKTSRKKEGYAVTSQQRKRS